VTRAQRGPRLFIKLMQRLPDKVDLAAAAVVQTG
jgi:acyl-CoA thioesterase-1